ncbi:MAG: hypothetical protein KDC44_17095, partial [Phaeodactylibacter sp.]|nr:hypothetical protein [Phaeodactylibacter sp.]
MTRIVQILAVFLLLSAFAPPAQGQAFLRRVVKKAQKLFQDEGALSDYYLYEDHRLIATELSFLIDPDEFIQYPFNLMTDLVIGEYDINLKTGEPRSKKSLRQFANQTLADENSEKRTTILELAYEKNRNLNFLFLVTALGDFGVNSDYQSYYLSTFLKENPGAAQDTMLEKIDRLLGNWRRNYKIPREQIGVVLDFPKLPGSENLQEHFLEMISELNNKGLKVYLKLPLQINAPFYSDPDMLAELNRRVDVFLLK